jgi:hypothetical protein
VQKPVWEEYQRKIWRNLGELSTKGAAFKAISIMHVGEYKIIKLVGIQHDLLFFGE